MEDLWNLQTIRNTRGIPMYRRTIRRLTSTLPGGLAEHLPLMGQSLLVFTSNIGGILSGLIFAVFFSILQDPILLMLFPAILTLRGDVNGILSSKLGTLLHTGRILPSLKGNTRDFETLLQSIFVFTFQDMLLLGLLAFAANLALGRVDLASLPLFILIPGLTGGISVAISEIITSALAIFTFRKGLDPDVLTYPVTSTINDVMVAFVYFTVSWLMLTKTLPRFFSVLIFTAIGVFSLFFALRNRNRDVFKKMFVEATPVIFASLSIGIVNGLILAGFKSEIGKYPGVLIVYPVLMSALGNIGAIIGATTTTKLFLGELEAKLTTIGGALKGLIPIEGAAFLLHIVYGLLGVLLSEKTGLTVPTLKILGITLTSNLITFPAIFIVAYLIAIMTFKKGLDPDNFVIPLETSIADSLATISISALTKIFLG